MRFLAVPFFSKLSVISALSVSLAALSACGASDPQNVEATTEVATSVEAIPQLAGDAGSAPTGAVYRVGEITVPAGFQISVFHEGVGERARHIAVRDNGDLFVARLDGTLIALRDTNGDGVADEKRERAAPISTDVEIRDGWLYISDRVSVSRIQLSDTLLPDGEFETVIGGFPEERQHADKNFAFDENGNIYVNIGAPANACQVEMRTPGSPGQVPCGLLENYAGIWKFNGSVSGQTPEDGYRFVTGTRNAIAMKWHSGRGGLLLANHGRDQLSSLFPDLFTDEQSALLPAEEFHFATEGADIGWPYTYYDPAHSVRRLAPEYGGDGENLPDETYQEPIHAFPAHWAPNDLILIENAALTAPFTKGALIAFHGSWNRAPQPQAGYRVVFVPMDEGRIVGDPVDFALGFAMVDPVDSPGDAIHRPMGLATGPDGAIYISDSRQGTIFRVTADNQ